MIQEDSPAPRRSRQGGRRKGSGKRADASAPWELRAVQALADASRWSMVRYVSESPATIGGIAQAIGLSVACTSKHVSILREASVFEVERRGREAICRIATGESEVGGLLRTLGFAVDSRPAAPTRQGTHDFPEFESRRPSDIKRYKTNDMDDFLL